MGENQESLQARLRKACVGHPAAKVLWPHRLLHEAANRLDEVERELAEEREGDSWQKRAAEALAGGTCPVCFATDEEGHKPGCLWGKAEAELAEVKAERDGWAEESDEWKCAAMETNDERVASLTEQRTYWKTRAVQAEAERDALREALTPSADTKAAYMGEFSFRPYAEADQAQVPWTTIKGIMTAIKARAVLAQAADKPEQGGVS